MFSGFLVQHQQSCSGTALGWKNKNWVHESDILDFLQITSLPADSNMRSGKYWQRFSRSTFCRVTALLQRGLKPFSPENTRFPTTTKWNRFAGNPLFSYFIKNGKTKSNMYISDTANWAQLLRWTGWTHTRSFIIYNVQQVCGQKGEGRGFRGIQENTLVSLQTIHTQLQALSSTWATQETRGRGVQRVCAQRDTRYSRNTITQEILVEAGLALTRVTQRSSEEQPLFPGLNADHTNEAFLPPRAWAREWTRNERESKRKKERER